MGAATRRFVADRAIECVAAVPDPDPVARDGIRRKRTLGAGGLMPGALLGGRTPTAALRASMARSADGSLGAQLRWSPWPLGRSLATERRRSVRSLTPPRSHSRLPAYAPSLLLFRNLRLRTSQVLRERPQGCLRKEEMALREERHGKGSHCCLFRAGTRSVLLGERIWQPALAPGKRSADCPESTWRSWARLRAGRCSGTRCGVRAAHDRRDDPVPRPGK